ncbi:hypothetical protein PtB15_10B511 [Puccinia triticina]|nr:hypothetical protein PtB15_10B511 [Puccinia triticina]
MIGIRYINIWRRGICWSTRSKAVQGLIGTSVNSNLNDLFAKNKRIFTHYLLVPTQSTGTASTPEDTFGYKLSNIIIIEKIKLN